MCIRDSNNIDNDLIMQNSESIDKLYFTPFYNKSILAINKDISAPKWLTNLPSFAVSVFDVFSNLKNSDCVLLPHPSKIFNQPQLDDDNDNNSDLVFIDRTSNRKEWFAMSFNNYPSLIKTAPISNYQLYLLKLQADFQDLNVNVDYLKNFQLSTSPPEEVKTLISGIHRAFQLSADTLYQPDVYKRQE